MKRLLPVVLVFIAVFAWDQYKTNDVPSGDLHGLDGVASDRQSDWRSGMQVRGVGVVTRVLSDDNDGSRHQRFIIRLDTGRTLLIAHNIDLAARVAGLEVGDTIAFNGEYEWNNQGGVVHWTHRDPRQRHPSGWLEHNGKRYQ